MPEFDWFAAHVFLDSLHLPEGPVAGTTEWAQLVAEDPRKLAALAVAGVWWTLAQDLESEARKQAAVDVAEGTNWPLEARQIADRAAFAKAHPWARRVVA